MYSKPFLEKDCIYTNEWVRFVKALYLKYISGNIPWKCMNEMYRWGRFIMYSLNYVKMIGCWKKIIIQIYKKGAVQVKWENEVDF